MLTFLGLSFEALLTKFITSMLLVIDHSKASHALISIWSWGVGIFVIGVGVGALSSGSRKGVLSQFFFYCYALDENSYLSTLIRLIDMYVKLDSIHAG